MFTQTTMKRTTAEEENGIEQKNHMLEGWKFHSTLFSTARRFDWKIFHAFHRFLGVIFRFYCRQKYEISSSGKSMTKMFRKSENPSKFDSIQNGRNIQDSNVFDVYDFSKWRHENWAKCWVTQILRKKRGIQPVAIFPFGKFIAKLNFRNSHDCCETWESQWRKISNVCLLKFL